MRHSPFREACDKVFNDDKMSSTTRSIEIVVDNARHVLIKSTCLEKILLPKVRFKIV